MIIGLLLGLFVSIFFASVWLLYLTWNELLVENYLTGAVIGAEGIASYAIIAAIVSIGVVFFLYLLIRSKHQEHLERIRYR